MSRTTTLSPAASTMGQNVSLLTSVTCPVTASAAPTEVVVSIPLDLTGATPRVSEAVVASSRLLFWAAAADADAQLLPTAKTAGRHVVEMGAGEEASPWDEEMVGMRRAIGLVRTYSLVDGSMGAELAEGTVAAARGTGWLAMMEGRGKGKQMWWL